MSGLRADRAERRHLGIPRQLAMPQAVVGSRGDFLVGQVHRPFGSLLLPRDAAFGVQPLPAFPRPQLPGARAQGRAQPHNAPQELQKQSGVSSAWGARVRIRCLARPLWLRKESQGRTVC